MQVAVISGKFDYAAVPFHIFKLPSSRRCDEAIPPATIQPLSHFLEKFSVPRSRCAEKEVSIELEVRLGFNVIDHCFAGTKGVVDEAHIIAILHQQFYHGILPCLMAKAAQEGELWSTLSAMRYYSTS